MTSNRGLNHIRVPPECRNSESYKSPRGGGDDKPPVPRSGRPLHAQTLCDAIKEAEREAIARRAATSIEVASSKPGIYLEFEAFPGLELAVDDMGCRRARDRHGHIEVVAVDRLRQRAVVFVPEGKLGHFLAQLETYGQDAPKKKGEKRRENVYDRIASIRLAALRELFTDDRDLFPKNEDERIYWEVWLRRTDGKELDRLREFCSHAGATLGTRWIGFDDRIVTLVYASPRALTASLDVMDDIAELRRAKETPTFFVKESMSARKEWAEDLVRRTIHASPNAPAVCLLDTGVHAGHPLLEGSIAFEDCHTCDPNWGIHDHHGHGTQMAGLALYGDLTELFATSAEVTLRHRLESVKILPPRGENPPELYGAITAEAVSRPEVQVSKRHRVFAMAVTSDGADRGEPTSWSAAIDALAAGRNFDPSDKGLKYFEGGEGAMSRLFLVSAGNVTNLGVNHLDCSDASPVEEPAHAWNALSVGAYTEKAFISDVDFLGYSPVAKPGDLSPYSTTSVSFAPTWPIKPEVLFEGGNAAHDTRGFIKTKCDDLLVLTTSVSELVDTTSETSAAMAQAARFCAQLTAEFPEFWPETIRALVVHSAEWTAEMKRHFDRARGKRDREQLVRRYGFGVPNLERALRSASNSVTLIAQDVLRPFNGSKMGEIHYYQLPWPEDALRQLGEASVRLRVTLSYFVEPSPARRGWGYKHRYQSYGLRFQVKRPTEPFEDFRKRLNQNALAEGEGRPTAPNDPDWFLGTNALTRGSIHSDYLEGTAAEIADRGVVAVYPVTGWWKERRDHAHRSARYSLIVSIETDAAEADLWTPIAQAVGITQAIET